MPEPRFEVSELSGDEQPDLAIKQAGHFVIILACHVFAVQIPLKAGVVAKKVLAILINSAGRVENQRKFLLRN